jgi:hypothetical protein
MSTSTATPTVRKNSALTTVRVIGSADLTHQAAGALARRAIAGVKLRATTRRANGTIRRTYK